MLILAFLFWLREPDLWAALYYRRPASLVYVPFRVDCNFTYWQCLLLFFVNPILPIIHRFLIAAISTFVYAIGLIFYALICYFVACVVAVYVSRIAYANLHRYNRGSLFRQSFHVLRCYVRDIRERHIYPPHILPAYTLFCFLWSVLSCVRSQSFLFVPLFILCFRVWSFNKHYGVLCRAISMSAVVILGWLSFLTRDICDTGTI